MSLICPVCQIALIPNYTNGIEIDVCEKGCKGIWFDDGEFKKVRLTEKDHTYKEIEGVFIPKAVDVAKSEGVRICPRCNIDMYRYNWAKNSNIFIDLCHLCYGTWLDFGELKGINNFQDQEQLKIKLGQKRKDFKQKKVEKNISQDVQYRCKKPNSLVSKDLIKIISLLPEKFKS